MGPCADTPGRWLSFLLYPRPTGPYTGDRQLFMTQIGERGRLNLFMKKEPIDDRLTLEEKSPGIKGPGG